MTLDEAIEERLKVVKLQEKLYKECCSDASKEIIKSATDNDLRLVEWLMELKEAKRLLKAAVEDIHELLCDKKNLDGNGQSCNICSYIEWCPCCKKCTIREDLRNWRYTDEALRLIGND